jgi:hypothetical protein
MEKQSIKSARLALRVQTASLIIGLDETHIVFPEIAFEKKDKPPKENLNTDTNGPEVVRVDVHQIGNDEARRDYYGHSGLERLTLFLPPENFSGLAKSLEVLRDKPIEVTADVDGDGNVARLAINGEMVVITPSSETRGLEDGPVPRAGVR